jgi:DNA-binding HxlR family transcriptional regulator
MRLLGSAWTARVMWYLREGERCFTELETDLQGVSAKVLTARLRRLEREGIVSRIERRTSPPTVWYGLTPPGRRLAVALVNVAEAAQELRPRA